MSRTLPTTTARGSLVLAVVLILVPATMAGTGVTAAAQAPAGWATFHDELVEARYPPGWQVQRDAATGRLLFEGARGERLLVWPFFVESALDPGTAGGVLARMAASQAPQATWGPARPVGPSALRADGHAGADAAVASLAWAPTPRGTAVQLVLAASPVDRRRDSEASFATIVGSIRLSGRPGSATTAGAGSPGPGVSWVRFQDPSEGAFSLDVPRGWRVGGGVARKAAVDVRAQVLASSPDNQMHLRLGDVELPPFTMPTPLLLQTGFREGSLYSPGYGVQMLVLRYLPGEQFAGYWVTTRLRGTCSNLETVSARPLPQAVQAMNAILARYGTPVAAQRLHAGDLAFRCQQGPTPMVGYLFTATMLTADAQGAGVWNVDQLQGYLATPDRAAQAQAVLAHMVASFQLNPQWVQMQQNLTASVSRIVADTNAYISRVISDTYWSKKPIEDEVSRRRSNAILGLEDVRDPVTGRELKVASGSNYQWIDHRGNVVGTTTYNRPNVDFRELVRLP